MTLTAKPNLNGVDVPTLYATLDAVKGQPEIAAFQFRASNTWLAGTHSRSTVHGYFGGPGPLNGQPLVAFVLANTVGMLVSYRGSRSWAFRHHRRPGCGNLAQRPQRPGTRQPQPDQRHATSPASLADGSAPSAAKPGASDPSAVG